MLYLTEDEVAGLLPMREALDAVRAAMCAQGVGEAVNQPRSRVRLAGTTLNVMSAGLPGVGFGVKTYTASARGARFHFLLYGEDGELRAVMEADRLGQIRTGAASGVATDLLARPDAAQVGIIGTGWQARTQLEAVCAVRPVRRVAAFGRNAERRAAFAAEMSRRLGVEVAPAGTAEEAVRGTDVVITITDAREPVLHGAWLAPGMHVNAAGANAARRRELDSEAVERAGLIAVDSREQARWEAGDLLVPIEQGLLAWERVHELGEILAGRAPGRAAATEITLFKSLGIALEDVAVGARVYARARAEGVGREIMPAGLGT